MSSSGGSGAAAIICAFPTCAFALSSVDDGCTFCGAHCPTAFCPSPFHLEVNRQRVRALCPHSKSAVAELFDGVCPCGASLRDHQHANSPRFSALEAPAPPPLALSAGIPTAKSIGVSAAEFAAHPLHFTLSRWNDFLQNIRGRSDQDRRLDHFKSSLNKDKGGTPKNEDDIALRELGSRCTLPGGGVREFAGLLASITAVGCFNRDCAPGDRVLVQRSSLCAGATGVFLAEEALNEVAVQRLLREGRKWFMIEVGKIREAHRSDVVNYIRLDSSKGIRRSVLWTDRYSRVLLQSYLTFLASRKPTWVPSSLSDYLSAPWEFPVRDSVAPLDLTGILVQIGVLNLVEQCEEWDLLGDTIGAVRAHLMGSFASFQKEYVQSSANLFEYKQLLLSTAPLAPRPAAGDVVLPSVPTPRVVPASLPPQLSPSATLAANVPDALRAGIRPDIYVYNRCQAHGCTVVPPLGYTTSRYCVPHIPPAGGATRAPVGGGGRFGNRGSRHGQGGRGGAGGRLTR
jgi:hypothetical protein